MHLHNHCYHRKTISITHSECESVILVIQHVKRKHHIVICGLSGSTTFFHIISFNGTMCGKMLMNLTCVFLFSLQLLSETFLIVRRILQDIIINIHMSSRKVLAMPVRFKWTLIFLTDFQKILKYQISGKSTQWDLSCSMQMGRQTWWS
jgi:hypothetical protein